MVNRCHDPSDPHYKNYGGRGITVCDRWRANFDDFLSDVWPMPSRAMTLDRIDNYSGYGPDNFRWATRAEQNRNMRNQRRYEYNGKNYILVDLAAVVGKNYRTFSRHMKQANGCVEEAVARPTLRRGKYAKGAAEHVRV